MSNRTTEEVEGEAAQGQQVVDAQVEVLRLRLRELGRTLRSLEDQLGGQFVAEARLAWLYTFVPATDARRMADVLSFLADQNFRAENWSDCVRPSPGCNQMSDEEDERYEREVINPVQLAFSVALAAAIDLVDELRGQFAPELQ